MYISPWMQACLLPRLFDVAGFICRPLTVWHHYILRSSGNRYFVGGEGVDSDAAAEVLMYAQGGIAHARRLYADPHYRDRVRRKVARRIRRRGFWKVNSAIIEYVESSMRAPSHRTVTRPGKNAIPTKPAAAPTEWILAEHIAAGNPDRLDAAWDTPYIVARCMLDAGRNIRGEDDSLISEEDERRHDEREGLA